MANSDKDTIYVDIDDEITGIIDKVKVSDSKVVALVLPKRATVFQSIVNMKLLKRAVDSSKKNLVLITSEAGLLPLAGAAGIHVAKTLTSRPEIPTAPQAFIDSDEAVDEDAELEPDEPSGNLDPNQTVGQLAKSAPEAITGADGVETLMLDNVEEPKAAGDLAAAKTSDGSGKKPPKDNKNKNLKVPNFNRFRLIIGIVILAIILLLVGFLILRSSLDKATIDIKTNATNVTTSVDLDLNTNSSNLSTSTGVIPAKYTQEQKTFSQTVNTTGQKNEGNEATGTVQMTAEYCGSSSPPSQAPPDVPAGTGASANNQTYITQQDTSFGAINYSPQSHCYTSNAQSNTSITAQSPGSSYNVSGDPFTIAGSYDGWTVGATGSASGGSDNIIQTVNQTDINNAKSKISAGNNSGVMSSLENQLEGEGYYPINATFSPGTPNVTSSSNVGQPADNVTVTESITYTMFGVHKSDLKTLVDNSINAQINTAKQSILDDGISSADYTINSMDSTNAQLTMNVKAVAGPELNVSSIKQNAAGHKAGDISSQIQADPDVKSVSVHFSPFWVSSAPKNASKIKVDIAKPTNSGTSN
jgi:hypothetical protein